MSTRRMLDRKTPRNEHCTLGVGKECTEAWRCAAPRTAHSATSSAAPAGGATSILARKRATARRQ
eukprot:2920771-Pleurochrysis_carterae.AAC.1